MPYSHDIRCQTNVRSLLSRWNLQPMKIAATKLKTIWNTNYALSPNKMPSHANGNDRKTMMLIILRMEFCSTQNVGCFAVKKLNHTLCMLVGTKCSSHPCILVCFVSVCVLCVRKSELMPSHCLHAGLPNGRHHCGNFDGKIFCFVFFEFFTSCKVPTN